jgi:hypothetical protein
VALAEQAEQKAAMAISLTAGVGGQQPMRSAVARGRTADPTRSRIRGNVSLNSDFQRPSTARVPSRLSSPGDVKSSTFQRLYFNALICCLPASILLSSREYSRENGRTWLVPLALFVPRANVY